MNSITAKTGLIALLLVVSACTEEGRAKNTEVVRANTLIGERDGVPLYQASVRNVYANANQREQALKRGQGTLATACPEGHKVVDLTFGPSYYTQVATQTFATNDAFIRFVCA